jgi:uncharacterized pyridoxal phosphate-containing UPF0001 family protein
MAERIHTVDALRLIQKLNRIRKKANKHRLEVEFHVGDAVNSKNEVFYKMKTLDKKVNNKLNRRYIYRPYEIVDKTKSGCFCL